jgi:hypothetical protein
MAAQGRGTTTIIGAGAPISPHRPSSGSPGCGCLLIICLVFFGLCTLRDPSPTVPSDTSVDIAATLTDTAWTSTTSTDTGGAPGSSGSVTSLAVPARPQFAAFTQRTAENPAAAHAVVFEDGAVEIIRVDHESEIPHEDRTAAARAEQHFARLLPARVHIFHGDVAVHVGELHEYDAWKSTFLAHGGDLARIVSEVSIASAPRAPPLSNPFEAITSPRDDLFANLPPELRHGRAAFDPFAATAMDLRSTPRRRVYVVGKITNFHGPKRYDHSTAHALILDLTPSPAERLRAAQEYTSRRPYDGYEEMLRRLRNPGYNPNDPWSRHDTTDPWHRPDHDYVHPVEHPVEVHPVHLIAIP